MILPEHPLNAARRHALACLARSSPWRPQHRPQDARRQSYDFGCKHRARPLQELAREAGERAVSPKCWLGRRGESNGKIVWSDCVNILGASESCSALSRVPDFAESGPFSFLVLRAHTIFSLPILHTKKIPANLNKSEPYQLRVEAVEPPEYEPQYFGALHRFRGSSGIWMDYFLWLLQQCLRKLPRKMFFKEQIDYLGI